MSQLLHLVFDRDENKKYRVVQAGLDEASVKQASFQELEEGKSLLYKAISVDRLHELMWEDNTLVSGASVLVNPVRKVSVE